jgi:hypothetical protein
MNFRNIIFSAMILVAVMVGLGCIIEANAVSIDPDAASRAGTNKARNHAGLVEVPSFDDREFDGDLITKADAEWRKQLTVAEYHILREQGTEAPYSHDFAKKS